MLGGRYRIRQRLGAGGQAEVFGAVDTWHADRPVALKRVGQEAALGLRREFAALHSLEHPGVVAALDLAIVEGEVYLVEEWIDGVPLARWDGRHDAAGVAGLLARVAHALAHLHARGVVHLDVTPHNILIEGASEPRAVLIDLGLSRPVGDAGASGTPGFVAPEILAGEPGTPAADVYGLAAAVVAVLGEGEPGGWGRPDLSQIQATDLRHLLVECLAEAPGSRPSALQVAGALATYAQRDDVLLHRPLCRVPLCGRQAHLADFVAWLSEGRGCYLATGVDGAGKTAFLRAAADRARFEGYVVLDAGSGQSDAAARLIAQATASASNGSSLLAELGPDLAEIVSDARLPEPTGRALTAEELAQLAVLALDAQHTERPTLVVVDDADDRSGALAAAIEIWQQRAAESGTRVLLATRAAPACRVEGARLAPLDVTGVEEMLRFAYAEPRPRSEAERLLELCGGLPEALIRALAMMQTSGRDAFELESADIAGGQVPELPESLVPLAASSEPVAAATVAALISDEPERQSVLRQALAAGALSVEPAPPGAAYRVPARVRQQARLDASASARLAGALAASGAALAAAPVWAQAGQVEQARQALRGGSGRAQARLAALTGVAKAAGADVLDEAAADEWAELAARAGDVEVARLAAQELERRGRAPEGRYQLAASLVRRGRYSEALDSLGQAADSASAAVRARALLFAGRAREARDLAQHSWENAGGSARADLLDVLGHAAFQIGDADAAIVALRRALVEAGDDAEALGRAQHGLAIVLQRRGERDEALALYRASLESAGPLSTLVRTRNLATLLQDRGDLVDARASYRDALSRAVAIANIREQAHVGVNLANLEVLLGELAIATSLAQRTLRLCEQAGLEHAAGMAALVLAEASVERRDLDGANRALERAAELLEEVEDPNAAAELDLLAARLAAAKGDAMAAIEALERVDATAGAEHIARQLAYWKARIRLSVSGADAVLLEAAEEAMVLARRARDAELDWRASAVLYRARERAGDERAELTRDEARARLEAFLAPLPDDVQTSYLACQSRRELAGWLRARREEVSVAVSGVGLAAYRKLLAINRRLAREHAVDPLLELIVDTAIELLGAERGFLILREADGVRVAVARNFDRRSLEDGRQRISRSIASEVLRIGEAVLTTNAQEDQRYAGIASVATLKVRSVICVPLRTAARDDDPTIGALYLDHRFQDRAFTEQDVDLCRAFSDQAAIALENARLLEQTRDQERRLQAQNERLEKLNAQLSKEAAAYAAEAEAALRRLREEGPLVGVGRGFERIVGRSDRLREALRLVDRFADTDVPVFISGESGTGKELIARAIHERSARSRKAFVSINCGAIPENLIESELFGYKKGAFTGAVRDKAGLFAVAQGGTLLLDEIGEMPLAMQVKLLRVLQEKEYRPVGATQSVRADVRILSASHRVLEELVASKAFREDLYYRLRVVEVAVPPLRARREDIPLLVDHSCRAMTGRSAQECFSPEALARLMGHDWPGNVRELDNEVRRALALADGVVRLDDLSERLQAARAAGPVILAGESRGSLKEIIDRFEREVLLATLERSGWNVRQTAKELGLSRAALYTRLHRFGITRQAKK